MTLSLPGYDMWLTRGADAMFSDDYIEGYPVVCTECGEHVHGKKAEPLVGTAHCTDDDTGEVVGRFVCDTEYDFTYDDPRIP